MLMISEDHPESSSSKLLDSGLFIEFTDGSGNIADYIKGKRDLIIFYDCNPNNKLLFDGYKSLRDSIAPERNIHIFPIVCVEYFIIKALVDMKYDFKFRFPWVQAVLEHVLQKKLIKNMPPRTIGYKGSNRNFEQFCKIVLDNAQDEIHNININDKSNDEEGSYYIVSSTEELLEKLLPICRNMPCCVFKHSIPNGFTEVTDYGLLIKQCEYEYEEWCSQSNKVKLKDKWWEDYE